MQAPHPGWRREQSTELSTAARGREAGTAQCACRARGLSRTVQGIQVGHTLNELEKKHANDRMTQRSYLWHRRD